MSLFGRAKQCDQSAARHEKMARKGRADPMPHASHADKAKDKRHAAGLFRRAAKNEANEG